MNARPDVPDTPDRTDAIARLFSSDEDGCGGGAWTNRYVGRRISEKILTTDDPAAIAALANQWAEHHHEALLNALIEAGVLRHEKAITRPGRARLVTVWREVTDA